MNQIVHATFDAPGFKRPIAIGRQLGQRYANTQLSGGFSGPFVFDRLFYNVSLQGGRRFSDLSSLLTGDPATLAGLGISRDSVSALTAAAAARGIPTNAAGIPDRRQTDNASVLSRFDWTPTQQAIGNITSSLRHTQVACVVRLDDRAARAWRRPDAQRRRRHRRVFSVLFGLVDPQRHALRRAHAT